MATDICGNISPGNAPLPDDTKPSPEPIRKSRDYVYGIGQYKVLNIDKKYFRIKSLERKYNRQNVGNV